MKYTKEKLDNSIKYALTKLYKNDSYLIEHQVSERDIVFWFAIYLMETLELEQDRINLDIEYNRCFDDMKRISFRTNGAFPDLIIHKRGTNERNILIMEFKTYWNREQESDVRKIEDFIDKQGKYKYQNGVTVYIGRSIEDTSYKFI